MIGAPRYYVEEQLQRGSLELKKEVTKGNQTICYYGDLYEEEGHLEYVFDENDILVSFQELEEVIKKQVRIRDLEKIRDHIIIGELQEVVEKKIHRFMYRVPKGKEQITKDGILQKYGMKIDSEEESDLYVYYDESGKVISRHLV